jgi:hypothetical protein
MKIAIGMIRYRGDLDRFIKRVLGRHKLKSSMKKTV